MKIKVEDLPVIKGTNGRKIKVNVGIEALKESGNAMVSTALRDGDVIAFPDVQDAIITSQEVRANGPKAMLIAVSKNGAAAYAAMGSFRKTDVNFKPIGEVSEELNKADYQNDFDRYHALAGRTVTVNGFQTVTVATFSDAGQRIGTEEREVPIVVFA